MLDSIEEEEKNDLGILVDIVYLYTDLGYPEKGVQWLKRGAEMYKDDEDFLQPPPIATVRPEQNT